MRNPVQVALRSINARTLLFVDGDLKMFQNQEGNHTLQFITRRTTPPSIPGMPWVQVGGTWVGELTGDISYLETVRTILTRKK